MRLGLSRCDLFNLTGLPALSVVVPRRLLCEVQRSLTGAGQVRVRYGQQRIVFEMGSLSFAACNVQSVFPPYQSCIPGGFVREVRVSREKLLEEMRSAAALSEEMDHVVIMRFTPGKAELSTRSQDENFSFLGEFDVAYDSAPFEVAFNHRYLIEALHVIENSDVLMKMGEEDQAVAFCNPNDARSLFLLAPGARHAPRHGLTQTLTPAPLTVNFIVAPSDGWRSNWIYA